MNRRTSFDAPLGASVLACLAGIAPLAAAQDCDEPLVIPTQFETTFDSVGVALGDLNGDRNLDAVVVSASVTEADIYLGDGLGGFVSRSTLRIDSFLSLDVELADLNGDGLLDLAVNARGPAVNIAFGNGDGTFGTPESFDIDVGANELAVADFDGDGDTDIAIAGQIRDPAVLVNDGTGSFLEAVTLQDAFGSTDIIFTDLDGDGDQDIVTALGDQVAAYINQSGTFGTPVLSVADTPAAFVAAGDVNQDGTLDLVTSQSTDRIVAVLIGDGAGRFTPTELLPVPRRSTDIALRDMNADGMIDIVTANATGDDIGVMLGDGAAGFEPMRLYKSTLLTSDLAVGDLDHNGVLDVVSSQAQLGSLAVLRGNGDGSLAAPQAVYSSALAPRSVVAGDTDGDGLSELVVLGRRGALFQQDTAGFQTFPAVDSLETIGVLNAIADFDGDGLDDIAYELPNYTGEPSRLLIGLSNGDDSFTVLPAIEFRNNLVDLTVGDRDGDGDIDIVGGLQRSLDLVILENDGTARFEVTRFDVGNDPRSVFITDADGDGDADIVALLTGPEELVVVLNEGASGLGTIVRSPIDAPFRQIELGDVNGDGLLDAIAVDSSAFAATVYFNDGAGLFTDTGTIEFPARAVGPSLAADIDGDGRVEYLMTSEISDRDNRLLALRLAPDGSALDTLDLFDANRISDLIATDTNGDGLIDVIVADEFDNSVSIIPGRCTTTCRADLDGDGVLTIFDFLRFQNLFQDGDLLADFDDDGELTIFDFLAFQNVFAAGCP